MKTVFVLGYWLEFEDYTEEIKTLGVYSSYENAMQALEKARLLPEYKLPKTKKLLEGTAVEGQPQGLYIDESPVDAISWREGFSQGY